MNSIFGIDPGKQGGVALIQENFATAFPMPMMKGRNNTVELAVDVLKDVWRQIDSTTDGCLFVYIEDVHAMPHQGVSSMFNFGYSAGRLRGLVEGCGLPVRMVSPVKWKNAVLGKSYAHDKAGALLYCVEHFPEVALVPKGHRAPHDGMADALCIAQYGWSLLGGDKT